MPSSVVANMHYNSEAKILRITYVSGKIYDYKAVPPEVYEEMLAAPSKGQFLNYHIKGRFKYKKVK